jgi:hypothetical protein
VHHDLTWRLVSIGYANLSGSRSIVSLKNALSGTVSQRKIATNELFFWLTSGASYGLARGWCWSGVLEVES